ncbi:MAG: ribosome biogenesis GTPase YlqF [Angelakisella sp.]|nr:ribosome biogenesis GTPase YlqF [Angelakisella sp.]
MSEVLSVQWFPGHMAKTRRLMAANMKLVDIVIELIDARIPQSSRNPEIDKLIGDKPRLILLGKCDFADEAQTRRWIEYYKKQGIVALPADCRSGKGLQAFLPAVRQVLAEKIAQWNAKGLVGRPIRMMIVGIPNAGKSSLINRLAGSRRAKVEDRPGVTRGKQWVTLETGVELLDMPGVLWPKFEDKEAGEKLAFVGAVKDDILDIEHLAMRLLETLAPNYASMIANRYNLEEETVQETDSYDLLELIGKKRGMMMSGGHVNTERAAIMVVDEFRSGTLGRVTLEVPE